DGAGVLVRRDAARHEEHLVEIAAIARDLRHDEVAYVHGVKGPAEHADPLHDRICPSPMTTYFVEVSSGRPIGPRACNFWVLIPISAPKPNWLPSVKYVEALA